VAENAIILESNYNIARMKHHYIHLPLAKLTICSKWSH